MFDFVELIGSPRQIAWASDIRGQMTARATSETAELIARIADAGWFICHQGGSWDLHAEARRELDCDRLLATLPRLVGPPSLLARADRNRRQMVRIFLRFQYPTSAFNYITDTKWFKAGRVNAGSGGSYLGRKQAGIGSSVYEVFTHVGCWILGYADDILLESIAESGDAERVGGWNEEYHFVAITDKGVEQLRILSKMEPWRKLED
jgi:hypothetical protein